MTAGIPEPREVAWAEVDSRRFAVGEGPRWDGRHLWLVDLVEGNLYRADDAAGPLEQVLAAGVPLGAASFTRTSELILAVGTGVALVDLPEGALAGPESLSWLARPEDGKNPPRRMNDATVDPVGRLWCGSMDFEGATGNGTLYRVGGDGVPVPVLHGLGCPNGPAFNGDGTAMYLADSFVRTVTRYPVSADGSLGSGELFARIPDGWGLPDGMTVDADDHLWVALWGGGAVVRFAPDGTWADVIAVPAQQPSSVCFAGPELDQLVVTTAALNIAQPGPWDGAVLVTPAPVQGRPPAKWRDARDTGKDFSNPIQ